MCLIVERRVDNFDKRPRSPPSSATVARTTATSLPMKSPTAAMKAAAEPALVMLPSARLPALPCVSASSSAGSGMPSTAAQPHALGHQPDLRREERVVDQLHQLTRTGAADMQDRVTVGAQQRVHARHRVVFAPDEQRHPARGNIVRTSAHRSVDHVDPAGGDRLCGSRAPRCVNDEHRTG